MSDSEEAERSVAILAALTDAMLRLARRGENRESLPGWRDPFEGIDQAQPT